MRLNIGAIGLGMSERDLGAAQRQLGQEIVGGRPALNDVARGENAETVVDGAVAAAAGLPGKPAPDTFLAAAETLGVGRGEAVVVEDASSAVEAGRNGDFGLVIGAARADNEQALAAAGADLVVTDLGELAG